ncbi:MAG: hypothetical protein BGO70_06380 [Bacteroidetes bacterium 43-93]|nr:hypothetical protein [Bacteroidota bacterium]OJW97413.1 MAG: hypothetical protein BGO70_06380 [Bacteroidetes bacterium 43-93]
MKKQTLLLLAAGATLAFASCNNNAPATGGMSQEQIDSTVNARVDAIRTELTAQNDSLINALALVKADSIIAAMKSGAPAPKPAAHTTKPKPTTKETKPSTPAANTPTGKNSQSQKEGTPTGKNSQSQQEGQPTGKNRH